MAKESRRKLLFIMVFLSLLLSYSAYASPIQSARAAEIATQEKGLAILNDVVGLDLTKYATEPKECPQSSYFGVVPQENLDYTLESNESKLKLLCTFTYGTLHIMYVRESEGSPLMTKSATSVLEMAKDFLSNYQTFSSNSFYGQLGSMLGKVDANKNLTTTSGNVKLEVTNSGDYKTFRWTYTFNGVGAACKCVALGYKNGFLKYFIDTWDLYKIGSTSVNLSEEEAIAIAMERAKTYSWKVGWGNNTFEVKDFKVTKAMMTQLVFCTSLYADRARSDNPLTLYPMWRIGVGLDKFYPGNVYGIYVDIWADTKEIRHVRAAFSTLDPQLIESQLFDESTVETLNDQSSASEAQLNSISITCIALTAFAVVVLGTAPVWLSRKKKSSRFYNLPKPHLFRIGAVLLCLLISSTMPLVLISTVNADEPNDRATIWGSTWGKESYTEEIWQQMVTANSIKNYFGYAGYTASSYQGSNTVKANILAQIEDSEQNYPRVAVVYFDHGVGDIYWEEYGGDDQWHYQVIDSDGVSVFDMDIHNKTALERPCFALINTCMSANITYRCPYGGGKNDYDNAVGMPYAWTHRKVKAYESPFYIGEHMSDDGYNQPDDGKFCYIGFPYGSASLSQWVDGDYPFTEYHTWLENFTRYALYNDYSVNTALDLASLDYFNSIFELTKLHRDFSAIWVGDPRSPMPGCTMVVYGNGKIHLYQPSLTVRAYDSDSNPLYPYVYIDGKYVGTTQVEFFRVSPGSHTLEVSVPEGYLFQKYTYNGHTDPNRITTISVTSDTTVTAHFVPIYHYVTTASVYLHNNQYYQFQVPFYIDGQEVGPTWYTYQVSEGYHTFAVPHVAYAWPTGAIVFQYWAVMGFPGPSDNPIGFTVQDDVFLGAVYKVIYL